MNKEQREAIRDAAYELLSTPRSHLRIRFEHRDGAVTVAHNSQLLTGVELDDSGRNAASALSVALGIPVPPAGNANEVLVSTGLLYRILAISDLDFTNPVAFEVANNLVDEAVSMQRSSGALSDA